MSNQKVQFTISLNDILSKDLSSTISKIKEFEKEVEKANEKSKKLPASFKPDLRTVDGLNNRLHRLTKLRDMAFDTGRIKRFNTEIANTQKSIDKIKFNGMGMGGRINAIGSQMGLGGLPLGGLAMAGAGAMAVGAIANKAFQSAVKASDMTADVRKSTGMSSSESNNLLNTLMARDSRTNISDQMTIAKIGGQIGIGKNDITGFTDVMDKAVVALADEFAGGAEEVTRSLGSIRNLFKETKSMNVSDSMTKIGDTINYLGATGTATGPVIADFVTRMGQLGNLKGSFREMAGMGAAFQEMGISSDIASGGISNILLTIGEMTKDGANLDKFAKLMKMSGKDATALFNKNPTKFLTTFANSLKGMDNTGIARTMQALKIGTQESIKAISVMADNTQFFTQRMTASAKEIGSLQSEFDIKNNTLAGSVDKLSNSWENLFTVLGNKNNGFVKYFVDGLTSVLMTISASNKNITQIKKDAKNKTISEFFKNDKDFIQSSALSVKSKGGNYKNAYFNTIELLRKEALGDLASGRLNIKDLKKRKSVGQFGQHLIDLENKGNSQISIAKSRLANLDALKTNAIKQFNEKSTPNKGIEKTFRGGLGSESKKQKASFDNFGNISNVKPSSYYVTINKIETNQSFTSTSTSDFGTAIDFKRKMKEGAVEAIVEAVNDIKLHFKS